MRYSGTPDTYIGMAVFIQFCKIIENKEKADVRQAIDVRAWLAVGTHGTPYGMDYPWC